MKRCRSPRWLVLLVGVIVTLTASAQSYPSRPIRIIVPYSAGTTPDLVARILGEALAPRIGQGVVIENRAGAGGKIGIEAAAKAKKDAYTFVIGSIDTHAILPNLYPNWDVDPLVDLTAVSLLINIPLVISGGTSLPASNIRELISYARANPGTTYGTPGVGTTLHLVGELLSEGQSLKLTHVPYRNFAEVFPSAMRGEVKVIVSGIPPALPFIRDGRLKAIAVTGTKRSQFLPETPTVTEGGIDGFKEYSWFALFSPAGVPNNVVEMINNHVVQIGKTPPYRERIQAMFAEAATSTPAELRLLVASEHHKWGDVIRRSGVKLD